MNFNGRSIFRTAIAGFNFTDSTYSGKRRMARHAHGVPYISYVLRGSYREQVGSLERECSANDVVSHSEGELHSVRFSSPETRILRIESGSPSGERTNAFRSILSSKKLKGPNFTRIASRLWVELRNDDRFSPIAIEGLMLELLAEIGRAESRRCRERESEVVEMAEDFLREEFENEVSLDKVANAVGVHPAYLSREFRRKKGVTFGEYLRMVRIKAACREIARDEKKLCDIALSAGFYDQSHFSNTFRRMMGVTPTEYRRSVLQG